MGSFYDRQGNPIEDVMEWERIFEDTENRIVAQTRIGSDIFVSTVWIGMDMSFSFGESFPVPLIFETMVFGDETGAEDWERRRYPTEQAAQEGHAEIVDKILQMHHELSVLTEGETVTRPE